MDDSTDGPLPDREYRRVLDATRTYREELVVRLAGEVGLRPREMAEITLADGRRYAVEGTVHHLLGIEGSNGHRLAYVPDDVWDALVKFGRERDREEADTVFDVSARRLQMLVGEVGDRVRGVTVSSRALRRTFARRALADGVDPRVIQRVGGWASLDTVGDLLDEPEVDDVVRAFSTTGTTERESPDEARGKRSSAMAVDALVDASARLEASTSRADVEQVACEALVDAGYDAAWLLGTGTDAENRTVRATAGDVGERAGGDAVTVDALEAVPGAETTGERVLRHDDVGEIPGLDSRHVVAVVPVEYGDTTYGSLAVVSSDGGAFAARERTVLVDLGRRLGQAIGAVTRRRLLRADTVVELEFETTADGSFLVSTARECGCSFSLEGLAPVSERSLVLYVRVRGTDPETVVDRATRVDDVSRARLIRTGSEDSVVELVVSGASVAVTLTEFGGNVTEYVVDGDGATVVAEFPTDVDVRGVVEGVTAAYPDTEFVAKRDTSHSVSTHSSLREMATDDLTDKQRSVLRSAYLAGYFDWPRGTTAEELADALDISSPTLHNHLRKAQRSILDELFDDRPS
ncbi:MAG: bacterio-opsin activator domain-containing protein [Halanaeroarchaeum sp.]